MKFFRHFQTGLYSYATAVLLIFRSQMWMAFAIPLVLSLGLYWGGEVLMDGLRKVNFSQLDNENGAQFLFIGVQAILVYVSVYMNRYLVLALLAPLLATLSVKTEKMLTGNRYPFNLKYYLVDVQRALVISFRNMGLHLLWAGLFLAITHLFSLPDLVYDCAYYFVAFYFYGFSFMDYPSERRRLNVQDSVAFTRSHAGAAFALGAVYGGLFFIPYIGVVIAPILGVVAGTIAVHEMVDLGKNPHAVRVEADSTTPSVEGQDVTIQ